MENKYDRIIFNLKFKWLVFTSSFDDHYIVMRKDVDLCFPLI